MHAAQNVKINIENKCANGAKQRRKKMGFNPLARWNKSEEVNLQVSPEAREVRLFSIKDKQINSFGLPFEAPSVEDVKAGLVTGFRDQKEAENPLVKYSQHFDLYELGKVNKESGVLTPYPNGPKLHFSLESLKG